MWVGPVLEVVCAGLNSDCDVFTIRVGLLS